MIIDKEDQRKRAILALIEGGGWKLYKEFLSELKVTVDYQIGKLTSGAITDEKVSELNFCLGKKKALEDTFAIEEILKEELEEGKISPDAA